MTTHSDRHPRGILGSALVVPASKGRTPRPRMAAISSWPTSLSASRQENPPQPRLRKHFAKRTKHIAGIVQAAFRNQTLPESPESEEPKKVDELRRKKKKKLYKCTYTRVHTCTHTRTHIPDTTWNSLGRIYTALLQGRTRWTGWYRLRCVPIIRGRFGRLWIPSIYAHKARRDLCNTEETSWKRFGAAKEGSNRTVSSFGKKVFLLVPFFI